MIIIGGSIVNINKDRSYIPEPFINKIAISKPNDQVAIVTL